MARPKVSLVIITLNEERNIERAIRSCSWVDEIILLDSGSRDRTVEIAKGLGAKTVVEPFRGFRAQKERANELSSHDWILSLDADEALSSELSQELQSILAQGEPVWDGLEIPRLSFYLGKWIKHGGWYPDYQNRFFHRKRARWVGGHVHEKVELKNSVRARFPIHHWVFRDISHQVQTNDFYSTKGALELFERKVPMSLFRMITKPPFKFIETYLAKLGFLDGWPGFIISTSAAYSMFLKYAKLWELERGFSRGSK